MPIVHNPESDYSKEVAKWNAPKREGGMNADGYTRFPAMLYKARPTAGGKVMCCDPTDEQFSASCQRVVMSPEQEANAIADGWRKSPVLALAQYEDEQKAIADAAAEASYAALRMTPKAQAERKGREAATHAHVAE